MAQLSLDGSKSPATIILRTGVGPLRRRKVLILGSGYIVRPLGMVCYENRANDWAQEFDGVIHQAILTRDFRTIVDYDNLGRGAMLAVPTNEHYLPLLYILGLQEPVEELLFFNEQVTKLAQVAQPALWVTTRIGTRLHHSWVDTTAC